MDTEARTRRRLALGALLVALLAWSASVVRGGFAYDDRLAVLENPVVDGTLPATEAFRRDYWHHVDDAGQYRPLATLSLRLDHVVFGERAWGYHLTNVLLHVLVTAVFALVLLGLPGSSPVAFLGLMVFAAHPVLADSVAWISGRTSMLGALGGAIALASVVRLRRIPTVLMGVTLGLLVGLLGKEDAVVFVLPVFVLAALRSRRLAVACTFSFASALAVYLVLRAGALGSPLPAATHEALADTPLLERLLYAGRGLLEGARLVLFPVAYPPSYRAAPGFTPDALPAAWAALGWAPWLALVVGGVLAFRRGHRAARPALAWTGASCAMAALALLPVLQIVPAGVAFAPRFLYLPLLFAAPAAGALLRRLPSILPALVVVVLVVGAWVRAGVYADVESYCRAVIDHVPGDAAARNDLGLALEAEGHVEAAHEAWIQAVQADPRYSRAWSNLGRAAIEAGDLEDATRFLRRAVATGPGNPVAHVNLGSVLLRRERYAEAADAYEEATHLAPGMQAAWRGLGHALWRAGDVVGARRALARALALAPNDERTRALLRAVGPD